MNFRRYRYTKEERTTVLLSICSELGIDGIAIDEVNPLIPVSMSWEHRGIPKTSVFSVEKRAGTWPAIWKACDILGEKDSSFRGYCGNSFQKQVTSNSLITGTYLLERGKWVKIT